MAALWPQVLAWELASLPALPGWSDVTVYDGPPVTGDMPDQYVTVGYVSDDDESGTYQLTQGTSGLEVVETGEVRSKLVLYTGDANQLSALRVRAFAYLDQLEQFVRSDHRLNGVLPPQSSVEFACVPLSDQQSDSTVFTLVFALHYYAVH